MNEVFASADWESYRVIHVYTWQPAGFHIFNALVRWVAIVALGNEVLYPEYKSLCYLIYR
jgi:hypothetical protein